MTKKQKKELIEYLDKLVEDGSEVKLCWEGGGDSGWVWFEVDGDKISERSDDEKIEELVDYMYDTLDYGSWAGEFSASGYALYDPKNKSFEGIDNYGEEHTLNHPCDIEIRIPKSLWFDRLEIQMEDEDPNIDAVFHVKNGFLTTNHDEYISDLINHLRENVQEVINDFISNEGYEYRSIWEHYELNRSDFKEKGDDLVYDIESLAIGTYDNDEKSVYLNLKEIETDEK